MNAVRQNVALGVVGALLILIVAFLVVQDRRHAWPFSRHHDVQTASRNVSARAVATADVNQASARAPVQVPSDKLETLGVRFEPVEKRRIENPVNAVATVVADESRVTHVHARVSGWLEELYVNTTGQSVRTGQPLAGVFSQELYSSQQEFVSALRRANSGPASAVLEAARTRLEVLGMGRAEIKQLEQTQQARRLVTISAPRAGVVVNRGVSAGTAVDPSTEIVTLADLTTVWVIAEVAESDAANVRTGSTAMLSFPRTRRDAFPAKVEFIYPTLTERTRTVRVRLPVQNKDGLLRPGMYGSAQFSIAAREALTVARDAVIDTGETQHVFVHTAADTLEPRTIKLGARLGDRIEVLEGLEPGDHVVTTGVFLIDSESRLRASGTTGHAGHGGNGNDATQRPAEESQQEQPQQHSH